MADEKYVRDIGGNVKRVPDEKSQDFAREAGLQDLSREQAQAEYARELEAQRAHEEFGTGGEAVMGGISGLTMGLAPALGAAAADAIDPSAQARQRLSGISESGVYRAGDMAGMVIPTFFSGGEALAARGALAGEGGLVARALASTPAAMLGRVGGAAEGVLGRFLPEASGVLGKAGNSALSMAARGASEGALINLSHTVGDNIIHDKPFASEALAALEGGALFGGMVGGLTGGVTSLGGSAVDAFSGRAGAATNGASDKALGQMAKRFGLSSSDIEQAQASGGLAKMMKEWHDALEEGGANFKSNMPDMQKVASENIAKNASVKEDVLKTLTEQSPLAVPSVARVEGRLQNEVMSEFAGTYGERIATQVIRRVEKDLSAVEGNGGELVQETPAALEKPVRPKKPEYRQEPGWSSKPGPAFYDKYNAEMAAYDSAMEKYEEAAKGASKAPPTGGVGGAGLAPGGELGSWKRWFESRDQLAAMISKADRGIEGDMRVSILKKALNVMDSEINTAVENASQMMGQPQLAKQLAAAEAGIRINKAMAEAVSGKNASLIAGSEPHLGPNDGNTLAWGALTGHPIGGAGIVAIRGIARTVRNKMEPAMAESAYRMSIGSKAAGAVADVKGKLSSSVKAFFSKDAKAVPARAASSASVAVKPTPENFQKAVDRTQELTSDLHRQRMAEYANELTRIDQAELAKAIMGTYDRANSYLLYNMPKNPKHEKAGSMRMKASPASLDEKQFRFMRIQSAVDKPVQTIVKGLEDGSLSRDQVQAIAYVYPKIIEHTVNELRTGILEKKAAGEYVDAEKIATLGVLFRAPVDTTLEKPFIDAVQQAHAANNAPTPAQNQGGGSPQPATSASSDFKTPLQNSIS